MIVKIYESIIKGCFLISPTFENNLIFFLNIRNYPDAVFKDKENEYILSLTRTNFKQNKTKKFQ